MRPSGPVPPSLSIRICGGVQPSASPTPLRCPHSRRGAALTWLPTILFLVAKAPTSPDPRRWEIATAASLKLPGSCITRPSSLSSFLSAFGLCLLFATGLFTAHIFRVRSATLVSSRGDSPWCAYTLGHDDRLCSSAHLPISPPLTCLSELQSERATSCFRISHALHHVEVPCLSPLPRPGISSLDSP